MRIGLHGGNSCGIKHIYGLSYYPDMTIAARKPRKRTSFGQKPSNGSNDMMQGNPYGKEDFFCDKAPRETYRKRFDRFVKFIKNHRSHGIIEVTLNSIGKAWVPILAEYGFKAVSSGKNSNTGSTITIYHLVY